MAVEKPQIQVFLNEDGSVNKELSRPPIENLSFKGGGVKGTAYIGVLLALKEVDVFDHIKRVSGTSAGAILALLVGLGLSPAQIQKELESTDLRKLVGTELPKKFELSLLINRAKEGIANLFFRTTRSKLDPGNLLLDKIKEIIAKRVKEVITKYQLNLNLDYNHITFEDLQRIALMCPAANFKDLIVTGVRLNDQGSGEINYFSFADSPQMEVATAIRISASIPYFFQPVFHKRSAADPGGWYIDGGVLDNYPIHVFEKDRYRPTGVLKYRGESAQNLTSLGVRVDSEFDVSNLHFERVKTTRKSASLGQKTRSSLKDWIVHSEAGTATQEMDSRTYHAYAHQTMQVSDQGVGMAEFDISESRKQALIQSSYDSTMQWFDRYYNNTLMEHKKYVPTADKANSKTDDKINSSFQAMCEDMSAEELFGFVKMLEQNANVIFDINPQSLKPESAENISKFYIIATNVLQQKTGLNKEVEDIRRRDFGIISQHRDQDIFQVMLNALTSERYDIQFRLAGIKFKKNSEIANFKIKFMNDTLEFAKQNLANTDIDSKTKSSILLKWMLPALQARSSVLPGMSRSYKNLERVAKSQGIDLRTLESSYTTILYGIKSNIFRLTGVFEQKMREGNKEQAKKIADKVQSLNNALNEVLQEIAKNPKWTDREQTIYLLKKMQQSLMIKTAFSLLPAHSYTDVMTKAKAYNITEKTLKESVPASTSVIESRSIEIDQKKATPLWNNFKLTAIQTLSTLDPGANIAKLNVISDELLDRVRKLAVAGADVMQKDKKAWSRQNLNSLFDEIMGQGLVAEKSIFAWKSSIIDNIIGEFEKQILIHQSQKKDDLVMSGFAGMLNGYSLQSRDEKNIEDVAGWKDFSEAIKKCYEKPSQKIENEKNVSDKFMSMLNKTPSAFLNVEFWEKQISELLIKISEEYLKRYPDEDLEEFSAKLIVKIGRQTTRLMTNRVDEKKISNSAFFAAPHRNQEIKFDSDTVTLNALLKANFQERNLDFEKHVWPVLKQIAVNFPDAEFWDKHLDEQIAELSKAILNMNDTTDKEFYEIVSNAKNQMIFELQKILSEEKFAKKGTDEGLSFK